jgi:hypothetical protein
VIEHWLQGDMLSGDESFFSTLTLSIDSDGNVTQDLSLTTDQVPVLPKFTNNLNILHFLTFYQYSLEGQVFFNIFEPIIEKYL